jgi:hypothetical protein
VAIFLAGITHDKGYVDLLEAYLEKEPDGGKVILLTTYSTQPDYLSMPFELRQLRGNKFEQRRPIQLSNILFNHHGRNPKVLLPCPIPM